MSYTIDIPSDRTIWRCIVVIVKTIKVGAADNYTVLSKYRGDLKPTCAVGRDIANNY